MYWPTADVEDAVMTNLNIWLNRAYYAVFAVLICSLPSSSLFSASWQWYSLGPVDLGHRGVPVIPKTYLPFCPTHLHAILAHQLLMCKFGPNHSTSSAHIHILVSTPSPTTSHETDIGNGRLSASTSPLRRQSWLFLFLKTFPWPLCLWRSFFFLSTYIIQVYIKSCPIHFQTDEYRSLPLLTSGNVSMRIRRLGVGLIPNKELRISAILAHGAQHLNDFGLWLFEILDRFWHLSKFIQ